MMKGVDGDGRYPQDLGEERVRIKREIDAQS